MYLISTRCSCRHFFESFSPSVTSQHLVVSLKISKLRHSSSLLISKVYLPIYQMSGIQPSLLTICPNHDMLLIVSLGMKSFASFKPPWIFCNLLKLIFNILKRKYFFSGSVFGGGEGWCAVHCPALGLRPPGLNQTPFKLNPEVKILIKMLNSGCWRGARVQWRDESCQTKPLVASSNGWTTRTYDDGGRLMLNDGNDEDGDQLLVN